MSQNYNADEVFEIAEQIERNGAAFYRKAAENAGDAEARKLFTDLAAMEDDHIKRFQRMRARVQDAPGFGDARFDPDNQAARYLQAVAANHVFPTNVDPLEVFDGNEAVQDVLDVAIAREKESIVFYVGIKNMMPAELGQSDVDSIIHEEMSHVVLLSEKRYEHA